MKSVNPLRYVLAYLLWFASMGLALLAAMAVRDTVRFALIAAELHRYTIYANSQILILLLGIVLLIYIVVTEHLYRTAVPKNKLMARFTPLTGWTLLILSVMHLFHVVTLYMDSALFASFRFSAAAIEFLGGVAFLWLARRLSTKPVLLR